MEENTNVVNNNVENVNSQASVPQSNVQMPQSSVPQSNVQMPQSSVQQSNMQMPQQNIQQSNVQMPQQNIQQNDVQGEQQNTSLVVKKESIFTKISNFFKNLFGKKKNDNINQNSEQQKQENAVKMDNAHIDGTSQAQIQNFAYQMEQLQANTTLSNEIKTQNNERNDFVQELRKSTDSENLVEKIKNNPSLLNNMTDEELDKVSESIDIKQRQINQRIAELRQQLKMEKVSVQA